jgi:hypothetical protein
MWSESAECDHDFHNQTVINNSGTPAMMMMMAHLNIISTTTRNHFCRLVFALIIPYQALQTPETKQGCVQHA